MPDWERQLKDLASLRDNGILSPEEFVVEKKKIVAERERFKLSKSRHGVQSQLTVFDFGENPKELSKLKTQSPPEKEIADENDSAENKVDRLGISAEIPKKRVKLRRRRRVPDKQNIAEKKTPPSSPSSEFASKKIKKRKRRRKSRPNEENAVSEQVAKRKRSAGPVKKKRRKISESVEKSVSKIKKAKQRPLKKEVTKRKKRKVKTRRRKSSQTPEQLGAERKSPRKRRRTRPPEPAPVVEKPMLESNAAAPQIESPDSVDDSLQQPLKETEHSASIPSDYALQLQWQKEIREIYIQSQLPLPKAPYTAETVAKYRAHFRWVKLRKKLLVFAAMCIFITPIVWQGYLFYLANQIEERADKLGWSISLSFPYSNSYVNEYEGKVSLVETMQDEVINALKQEPKLYSFYDLSIGTKIPKGSFLMGNSSGEVNEKPSHTVEVSHDFIIMTTEVTLEFFNYIFFCKTAHVQIEFTFPNSAMHVFKT